MPQNIKGNMSCYAQFYFIGSEDDLYQFTLSDFNYSLIDKDKNGINDSLSLDTYVGVATIGRLLPIYEIDRPYQVLKIGTNAFRNENTQVDLEVIQLPDTLEEIGQYAFWGCSELNTVIFPSNLKVIGGYAFTTCKKLLSVEIPDTVEVLGPMAFYDTGLVNIVLPTNIKDIGMYAFTSCKNLTDVTFKSGVDYTKLKINPQCFENSPSIKTINVPWSEGDVEGDNVKWGAINATINYNYVEDEENV